MRDQAERLLALSRECTWTFPSSAGSPLDAAARAEPWVERLLADEDSLTEAAHYFLEVAELDAAAELAANAWRLWMVSRDVAGGRLFLAPVLAAEGGRPRERAHALYGDGLFAFWQGEREDARRRNEDALAAAEASGDAEALVLAHLA